jgi:hypothetical protein
LQDADLTEDEKNIIGDMLDGDLNEFARTKGLPKVEYVDPAPKPGGPRTRWEPINKAMFIDKHAPGWNGEIEVGGEDWGSTMEVLDGWTK